jgi:hypothetical protein
MKRVLKLNMPEAGDATAADVVEIAVATVVDAAAVVGADAIKVGVG